MQLAFSSDRLQTQPVRLSSWARLAVNFLVYTYVYVSFLYDKITCLVENDR